MPLKFYYGYSTVVEIVCNLKISLPQCIIIWQYTVVVLAVHLQCTGSVLT